MVKNLQKYCPGPGSKTFQYLSCDSIWSRGFPCLRLFQDIFQFLQAEEICHGTVSFFIVRWQNDVLCLISDLSDALSGYVDGALFLVKIFKNIWSSLLSDWLIACFCNCFASLDVIFFLLFLSNSTYPWCLFPCLVMLSFHTSYSSWLVILPLCTAPLPCCVPPHLRLLASFPSSLLLGLRSCAGCQALGSIKADSLGAFVLGWTDLLFQEQPVAGAGFKQFRCCSFPVHCLSKSILLGLFVVPACW